MKGRGSILLIILIILVQIHYGDAKLQSGARSYYSRNSSLKSSRTNTNIQSGASSIDDNKIATANQKKNAGTRGSSLSAWGIISIVIAAIILMTSGYYAFVFYPFLCKRERNYDMIELASVV